ncbi:MAG: hypothetical protein AB1641_00380 [Thermodesulfobacteriota bacterium]
MPDIDLTATRRDIEGWLAQAKEMGASHVIVVYDAFDYHDYPVYVMPGQDVREKFKELDGVNMQRVMEVYSLKLPVEEQLSEHRAFHFD